MSALTSAQHIELLPLWIRRIGSHYILHSLSGKRMLKVNSVGADIVQCLQKNPQVDHVLNELEAKYQERLDIGDFLNLLQNSRMLHKVDGAVHEPQPSAVQVAARKLWLHFRLTKAKTVNLVKYIKGGGWQRALSILPVPWTMRFYRVLKRRSFEREYSEVIPKLAVNIKTVLPERSMEEALQIARQHVTYQGIWDNAEKAAFQVAPVPRLLKWIPTAGEVENQDLLREAIKDGKGVILSFFHFGPAHLTAMLLRCLPLNLKITVFGQYRGRGATNNARVRFINDFSAAGVMQVMERINQGEVVIMAPDAHMAVAGSGAQEPPKQYGGKAWKRSSRKTCTFFGREVLGFNGLQWLQKQTGCPVLNATIYRRNNGKVRLELSPVQTEGKVLQTLFTLAESQIRENPEQWMNWFTFPEEI